MQKWCILFFFLCINNARWARFFYYNLLIKFILYELWFLHCIIFILFRWMKAWRKSLCLGHGSLTFFSFLSLNFFKKIPVLIYRQLTSVLLFFLGRLIKLMQFDIKMAILNISWQNTFLEGLMFGNTIKNYRFESINHHIYLFYFFFEFDCHSRYLSAYFFFLFKIIRKKLPNLLKVCIFITHIHTRTEGIFSKSCSYIISTFLIL